MVASRPLFQLSYPFSLNQLEEKVHFEPTSPELFYEHGSVLFEIGAEKNCIKTLRKSSHYFKQATVMQPSHVEAWHGWGCALALIGRKEDLLDAKEKMEKAVALAPHVPELHWDTALIYLNLSDHSGEIDDIFNALSHFTKCEDKISYFEFWNSYGNGYIRLSEQLDDIRPVLKAVSCFKHAIALSLNNADGWLGLARSLQKLYRYSHENDHYNQACDCFAAAIQLLPQRREIALERIAFIIETALRTKETSKLRVAIDKCEQASSSPHLLGYYSVALAFLGTWTGRVELLHEAEEKINRALENDSDTDDPLLIFLSGQSFFALAEYHRDLDLYYQAVEEFQASLSLDRSQLACWVWMGHTYSAIYERTDDVTYLERALHFYSKSLQIKNDPHLYFEIASLLIELGDNSHTTEPIQQAISYLEYLFQTYKAISFDHPEWFYHYGIALNKLGDFNEESTLLHKALEAFINVLMFNPAHPKIHHRIGIVYSHLGDILTDSDYLYRSLHHFKLASKSQEEDEALLIDWGLALLCLGEEGYREAEAKFMQAALLGSQEVYYHLACLYSLQGAFDLSITYLQKSHTSKNLPPIDEIMDDEWLDGLRLTREFQEFLALLK